MGSQITSLTIVYLTVYLGADQRKHRSSASLAFVRRIHRWPVNSPHKWPVTRKMFPFDDAIKTGIKVKSCWSTGWQFMTQVIVGVVMFQLIFPGQNGRHFADDIFKCISMYEKFCILFEFHWSLFLRVPFTIFQLGLDNGLAPIRLQAIIWTNAHPVHWRIYEALRGDDECQCQTDGM